MLCSLCKKKCGLEGQPPLYVFLGNDYCKSCIFKLDSAYKSNIDRAQEENERFKRRFRAGTYMKNTEPVLLYGKRKK